jgi:hypothetical protein
VSNERVIETGALFGWQAGARQVRRISAERSANGGHNTKRENTNIGERYMRPGAEGREAGAGRERRDARPSGRGLVRLQTADELEIE